MKKGWKTRTLAEVCQIKPPKAEARRRISEMDLVSFVPMQDLGIDQKFLVPTQTKPLAEVAGSYTFFTDDDVLLAKITPCFENGKLGIAADLSNGIGFGSSEFIVFRPCVSLDKEYLYYYLSRADFRSEGAARMGGAVGHQRVAKEFIESYPISVPPIPEQRQIVGILDEAFDGIATAKANAEKNLQNARALFESHLNGVFTQHGDGWVENTIQDLCVIGDGNHGEKYPKKSDMVPSGVPFIRGTNLVNGRVSAEDILFISPEKDRLLKKGHLQTGDVLFTNRGEIGKVAIVDESFHGANLNSQIAWLRCQEALLPGYLFFFLQSSQMKQHFEKTKSGAALQQFTIRMLSAVVIAHPTLPEQQRLVSKFEEMLSETQRLESIYQRKLAALDELKKSLLHQAFSGQLTGPTVFQEVTG